MALYIEQEEQKEALDAGFRLEDTGILEIEKYLTKLYFGSNSQKGELVIQSLKSTTKIIEKQKSFNYELKLLSKSKDELEKS